ncbi:hypothetical protein AB5I41_11160 [Sphingomonas sp. MMS24-JH45]
MAIHRAQGLGDIIVTAQRRSENLQNVPIAITAAQRGNTPASVRVDIAIRRSAPRSPSARPTSPPRPRTTGGWHHREQPQLRGLGRRLHPRRRSHPRGGGVAYFLHHTQVLRGPQGTLLENITAARAAGRPPRTRPRRSAGWSMDEAATRIRAGTWGRRAAVRDAGRPRRRQYRLDPRSLSPRCADRPRPQRRRTQAVKAHLLFEPSSDFSSSDRRGFEGRLGLSARMRNVELQGLRRAAHRRADRRAGAEGALRRSVPLGQER